ATAAPLGRCCGSRRREGAVRGGGTGPRSSEVTRALFSGGRAVPNSAERFRACSAGGIERSRTASEGARSVPSVSRPRPKAIDGSREAGPSFPAGRPIPGQDAAEPGRVRRRAARSDTLQFGWGTRARPNRAESPSGPAQRVEESRARAGLFRSCPKAGEAGASTAELCRVLSDRARIPLRLPERRRPNGQCPNPPERDRTGPSAPTTPEGRSESIMSAVPLQLLFYVNGFYLIFYFLATLAMLLYKSQAFSYPEDFLSVDLTLLVITAIAEVLRLYLGVRGNLTEEESLLGLSLVMTVGSVFLAVYFLVWQTYVLKTDVILNSVLLFFYGMESILKISAIAAFNR
ncbi:transmembrane protein 80, partial [Lathamus discolor]|uniref:transmembrane protein 80 n=1 Tax=Lathamus discolor TaxID=678569 RepID=UPI0032B858CD